MPDAQGILNSVFDPVNNALRVTGVGDLIFIPASAFTPVTGTPAPVAVPASGETGRLALDGAATETIAAAFRVPNWWGTFTPDVYFVNETVGTGNIRWTVSVKALGVTDLVTEAAVATNSATIASGAQNAVSVVTPITSVASVSFGFDVGFYELVVSRLGGDALDTHVGDIGVAGAAIRRLT